MTKARQLADLGNAYDDGALSNRNLIINGAMQVAQRGTSQTNVSTFGVKTVDRWKSGPNSFGIYTNTQDTNAPAGFGYSSKWLCTTADTSPASTDYMRIDYGIEAQDLQHLNYGTSDAKDLTLSFWVKSNVAETYVVWFYKSDGTARHIAFTYVIDAINTWEYKTITIPSDSNALGVINNDNGEGLLMCFCLSTSTANSSGTLPSAWENYVAVNRFAGQTANVGGAVNNYWQITGVQLEVGDTATPFEHRSYGEELARCQRYFWAQVPKGEANGAGGNAGQYIIGDGGFLGTGQVECHVQYPVQMRASPTLQPSSGTNHFLLEASSGIDYFSNLVAFAQKKQSSLLYNSGATSGTAGEYTRVAASSVNSYVYWDAEL